MTQQLDPKQVRGLKEELDTLDSMVKIKSIGANLSLDADGELSATGGGGGGDAKLYSTLGNNIDGALTQKASTDLLVHAKPDGTNDLIANNKITLGYLPDSVLGQVVYGGGFVPSTAVATLTTNAQEKLGTSDATITLTNDTTAITGYEANEGIYYIATASGTFASISFETGDWLISIGTAWSKVDNTDAVTGVKGNEEVNYRLGNVNITAQNVGAVTSDNAISTQDITPFITTSMINDSAITTAKIQDEAVTTAKIDDGAITTAKIASGAVTSSNIDFTTPGFQYQPGTYTINDSYWAGRGRTYTGATLVRFSIVLPKTIPNGSTVTLTPDDSYGVEVFGPSGIVVSSASTLSLIVRTDVVASQNSLYIELYFDTSQVTVPNNVALSVRFAGTITVS